MSTPYQPLPMRAAIPAQADVQYFCFEEDGDTWKYVPSSEPVDPAKKTWFVAIFANKWRNTSVTLWRDGKSRHMSTHNLPQQVRAQLMLMGHNVK